jgi:hypothetical protein
MTACGGRFELDGRRVLLVVEPEGWLVGWTPLEGAPDRWLARQPRIQTLAKIVSAPALRVDVPILGSLDDAGRTLRAVLRDALACLADDETGTAEGQHTNTTATADRAAGEILNACAASSPWLVSTDSGTVALVVETARGRQQRITANVGGGCLRLTALLGPRPSRPAPRRAITRFLLTLNERVRLARGTVGEAGVGLEVVLPSWTVNEELLDRAIGALVVAAGMAKRECVALLDPTVAEVFCAFHRVAALSPERVVDACVRAPQQERSMR